MTERRTELDQGGSRPEVHVLHVHSGNLYGGIEVGLAGFARGCAPYGVNAEFALCFDGRAAQSLTALGMKVHLLGPVRLRSPWMVARGRRALSALLAPGGFDVVIVHSSWTLAIFGTTIRASGAPIVFHVHDTVHAKLSWLDRLAQRTRPDLALCNSAFTAGTLDRIYPSVRRTTIQYGFEERPVPSGARAAIRRELNIDEDVVMILQVSRMEAWKGHELHLAALARLNQKALGSKWVCVIAGGAQRPDEEVYLAGLLRTVEENGLGDHVRFIGQRSDVPSLMEAADIFCQPNKEPEPFGVVFLEALDAGLPVVSVAMGGVVEIVDPSCGILVPPADVEGVAEALATLIEDRPLRLAMRAPAKKRARAISDPRTQSRLLREALSSVVDSTGWAGRVRSPNAYVFVADAFAHTSPAHSANYALALRLARLGHQTHLVGFQVAPDLAAQANVHVHLVPGGPRTGLLRATRLGTRGLFEIARLPRGTRVVVQGERCPAANAVQWVDGIHAAAALHEDRSAAKMAVASLARSTEKVALQKARIVIATSNRARRELVSLVGVDDARIRVVRPGMFDVPRRRTAPDRASLRERLSWPEARPKMLFVGSVADRKTGFDTLFAAFSRLCASSSWDADLAVVDDEATLGPWAARVRSANLDARVSFHGAGWLARLLEAGDLVVAPSRYEPYGYVVQQALAREIPAITSATCGVAELYPKTLDHWLVPDPEDDVDLAARLSRWRSLFGERPAALRDLSSSIRARTWDVVADEIVDLVER